MAYTRPHEDRLGTSGGASKFLSWTGTGVAAWAAVGGGGGSAQFDEAAPRYRFKATFNTLAQESTTTVAELQLNGAVGAPYAALLVDELDTNYAGLDMAGATGSFAVWSKGGPIEFYPGDGGAPGTGEKVRISGGHGLVVPSLTADPSGANSEAGQVYYNTTSGTFRGYDGTAWGELPLI